MSSVLLNKLFHTSSRCMKIKFRYFFPISWRSCVTSHNAGSDLVRVKKQEHLYLIGINRPEKRNCVNAETACQLRAVFKNFEEDKQALVAVLHGIGGTFCAGLDLKEIAAGNVSRLSNSDGPMGPTKMTVQKPVIAAVDGYAVAGGFELAIWCDLRVMEETAIMGIFSRRFGVPLIDGGTMRLPKLIGLAKALDIILTGRAVDAKEAYAMGLVSKVCKKGQSLDTAIEIANAICKFPQDCMNIDTNSTYKNAYNAKSLDLAIKYEIENASHVFKEAVKGAETFMRGSGRHGKSL